MYRWHDGWIAIMLTMGEGEEHALNLKIKMK